MGQRHKKLTDLFVLTTGLTLCILASIVMIGWFAKSTAVVQIKESYVPMQFNTAFCFFLLGMGCLAIYFRIRPLIIISGILALIISGTTFIEYSTGSSLGIDELFFTYNLTYETEYPGRMALNTSVCFMLSTTILLLYFQRGSKTLMVTRQILSSVIIMVSGLKLYGYISGVESAIVWLDINRMALHTALGFFIFGLTIFLKETMRSLAVEKLYLSTSVCVATILLFLSICIVYTYEIQKDIQLEEQNREYVDSLVKVVENEFSLYTKILQQLSVVQHSHQAGNLKLPNDAIQDLKGDFPFLTSVRFVSEPVISPSNGSKGMMFQEDDSSVYELQLPVNTNPDSVSQPHGYLIARIDITEMISFILKGHLNPDKMYWELYNGNGKLIQKESGKYAKGEFWRGFEQKFKLLNQTFSFRLFHRSSTTLFDVNIGNVALILLLGAFSLLSSMVVYFAQRLYQEKLALQATIGELEKAKYQAEQASIAKTSFLSNLSHEIRTPLNGIICGITLVHNSDLDNKQKRYLDRVEYCGNILLNIINDTLDISKIESGRLQLDFQPTNIQKTIQSLYDIMKQNASEKRIQLTLNSSFNDDIVLFADDLRLKQILQNLLSNAIKFTEEGCVTFTAGYEENDDETILTYFEVSDTGIGIKEEAQSKIFEKFHQADNSTTRKYGGTGLGLAICRQLVDLYEGEIGVHSEYGKGSTFWVKIPLKKAEVTLNLSENS